MEASHNIQVTVDASRGVASLRDLQRQSQSTAQSLRSLGSGNGFDALAKQAADVNGAFSQLARSLSSLSAASSRIASMSSSGNGLANMSRGAHDARNAVNGLTAALNPLNIGIAALSATIGAMSLSKFVSDTMAAGTSALNLRIAVDSVASGSGEAGRALAFIRKTALELGQPLDVATKQFANFYTSARALGKTPETIENVWRGLSTAMSALHVSRQDQSLFMRELQETYAMGKIDATRLIRSMATHLPGLSADMQQALGISGAKMHEMFKNGGLPVESWEKLADLLEKRYGSGVATASQHAQGAVISLSNSFELLQQKTFDQGLDSGFATLANTVNNLLKPNIDSLSQTLGTMFRAAGAGAALFVTKLYEMRDSLTTVAQIIGGYAVVSTAFRIAAASAALIMSPLGLVTGLALALQSQWETLGGVLSGSDAQFRAGANYIKNLTGGVLDFERAIRGGIKMWELFRSLAGGSSFADAQKAAVAAAQQFDAGEYGKRDGNSYTSAFEERLKRITDALKGALPGLPNLSDDFKKLYDQSAPIPFEPHGNYAQNAKEYAKPYNELSEALKKVHDKLLPANKALQEYRENLAAIEQMTGKVDSATGKLFDASTLDKMRAVARESAFKDMYPAADRIREMMSRIKDEQEALARSGGDKNLLREERSFLEIKSQLKAKHVEMTREEEQAIRALIRAESDMNTRDGLSKWAEAQKTGIEGINDSIGHGLDTISDSLAKILTTGRDIKATFRDMLRSISADLIRQGLRSLMAEGIKGLNPQSIFGNGAGDSIAKALGLGQGVIDKANSALDDAAKSLSTVTGQMDVQAAVVNINGGIASGLNAFRPGSDISSAVNAPAVGGVLPRNDNGAPLFSGNVLPQFGANVRTGALGSITKNSVAEFGKDLVPSLGALPGFKDALKSSADGITKNSVAEFGKGLQKLAPVVQRAGLTPISGSLADLYKQAGLDKLTERNLRTVHPDLQEAVLKAKMSTGANIMINDGMGIRTPAQAAANAAAGRGILHSKHLTGDAVDVLLKDKNGRLIEDGSNPAYRAFNDAMQSASGGRIKWGGTFSRKPDWDHWERMGGGSKHADLGKQLGDQTAKTTQEIQKQLQAQRSLATETQKSFKALAETTQPLQGFDGGVTKLSENLAQAVPAADSFTGEIEKLLSKLLGGIGGGGGLGGGLGDLLGGLFSEGGYSDSPVSSASMPASFWAGAPAFAEGTPNTSGGMPAILHDNEAVIPLSRGRSIPVEINGGDGVGGGNSQPIVQNFSTNITARDHDSFRRNHSLVLESMHKAAARAMVRNG